MAVRYHVLFEPKNGEISVTHTFNNNPDSDIVTEEISKIQEMCEHFNWNQPRLSQEIGEILFTIVNGNNQLEDALTEADAYGEPLQVFIQTKGSVPDLPFELLYDSRFLVPSKIHVIRKVSDYGYKKKVASQGCPLRVLFMACSPQDVAPVLDFEEEEDTILEVTKDLPVDIDVEDTGSLQGLKECLVQNEYDIIHLTGHANIEDGVPYFCMENEEGFLEKVTPLKLQNTLNEALKRPRLVFLSGCKTGETPYAAASFAHELVVNHSPTVVGWGLPVSDRGATIAATRVYRELSRGKSILDAVSSARKELFELFENKQFDCPDWCLLRLFSDGTPLDILLVEKGQKKKVKARDIQYAYLLNSQVKVLKKGFVGRRRQIQKGIRSLKKDEEKVGLLLHGTGGLGKSCLAGKFCDRFKDHTLIVVHGELNAVTLLDALKRGFMRAEDEKGLQILQEEKEIVDKIMQLCSASFQEKNYLIVLDDFEKNLEGYEYTFPLTVDGRDLITEALESIGLTSFRGSDERKKISELEHIRKYPKEDIRKELIAAGRGNPRLMEALNDLVKVEKNLNITALLKKVKGKQDEFVQELILKEILKSQPDNFQKIIQYSAVFRLPVLREGIQLVCKDLEDWKSSVDLGVQLSLMEEDKGGDVVYYWVTPLLQKDIFEELPEKEKTFCHKAAVVYYRKALSLVEEYFPVLAFELIEHALQCGMDEIVLEEGRKLLSYLRYTLAYTEALSEGDYILSQISEPKKDEKFSSFLFQLGWIHYDVRDMEKAVMYYEKALEIDREIFGDTHTDVARDLVGLGLTLDTLGDSRKAVEYYEKALKIDKKVYGENHPDVAAMLNNLGSAWYSLGDPKKAVEYYEKALKIGIKVYGENHPSVATRLNNLGLAWDSLGDPKKAVGYYEKALKIDIKVYGETHPNVATRLNNLGGAWDSLGDPKKAVGYYEKALKIDIKVYGENHPDVAIDLNNLGLAWDSLGDPKKAVGYYEKALKIGIKVYGENHPSVATRLNNLGGAWDSLGDPKKAVEYYEKALKIDIKVYGENHPSVATRLNNLGLAWYALGDPKKAVEYIQQAYTIFQKVYGDQHPHTRDTKQALDILKDENK